MAMNAASMRIREVDIPSDADPGSSVGVRVIAENINSLAADGESFDIGWCQVYIPELGAYPIWHCAVIAPGDTFEFDGCTADVSRCTDGDFTMPQSDVTVEVTVGGTREADFSNCADAPFTGNTTDSATDSITAFDTDLVSIPSGGCIDPGSITVQSGDPVPFTATVANENDQSALADVVWRFRNTGEELHRFSNLDVPPNATATTPTTTFDFTITGSYGIDVFAENIRPQ